MTIHLTKTQVVAVLRKHFQDCYPGEILGAVTLDDAGAHCERINAKSRVPVERARVYFDAMRDAVRRAG